MEEYPQQELPNPGTSTEGQTRENRSTVGNYTDTGVDQRSAQRRPFPLPPEPLTEFQKFVAVSTGLTLPIYGADFFKSIPSSFGPLDHGPAPGEMIIGVDDELRIRVWGQVNFSANVRVSREGEIYIPKVGAVHVAGLPFSEVSAHLRSVMARVYRNFEMSVDVGEIHSVQIYVTGLARQPGEYTVSALSTLVDAVFASGGPSAAGSMRHVLLKRSGKVVTDFDLYALLVSGDKTGDTQLQSGDVLYIPPAGPQVAILGSVGQVGIYELRGKESIDKMLDAAGGKTAIASGARLSLERIEDHSRRRAFDLATDPEGLATLLAGGDIVRINPIISSYSETVTLRGAVANPGHFRWHEGMRLSELLPDKESLAKRDYWWRRTQLGLPAPEFTQFASPTPSSLYPSWNPASPWNSTSAPNPGWMPNSAPMPSSMSVPNSMRSPNSMTPLDSTSNPAQAWSSNQNPNSTSNPNSYPNSQPNSNSDLSSTPAQKLAAVESPAIQTNWNYAVIERLNPSTMKTSLIPFSLGKLVLDHDMSQDLELMPGDVVTIFTQADIQIPVNEQTKYITLEGEFVHPGVYSVSAGETLRSVIDRAGGLTKDAYLYASVFTRKSTQVLEQEHLNQSADQLERQLVRDSMPSAGEANSTTTQQALSVNRELIARIRSVRASGRIVLNMVPHGNGDYEFPDVHLEDGDRLVVPFMPQTVQVLGAVFNPHAFVFHQGARAGEYLRLAGGPSREADRRRVYILRADGTVSGQNANSSLLWRGFSDLRLHPGDSIVVPEKTMRPSNLTQALAWAQAFSAISTLAVEAVVLTH